MARILDTTPEFEAFARKAALESRIVRESLWRKMYEQTHQKVLEAFYEGPGSRSGLAAVMRELSRVRERTREAAPIVTEAIEEVDDAVRAVLEMESEPAPLHVLMVGTFSANAAVGRLNGDVAVFHCLEWYQTPEGAKVLAAHETTHARHELIAAPPEDEDALWTLFAEGLAVQASRRVVPDRPEEEYFWYGHAGFEDWLEWCRQNRTGLLEQFRDLLDDPGTPDLFFGSGRIEGFWRVGFFIADDIVGRLRKRPAELARMSHDDARAAVRKVLDRAVS